MLSLRALTPGTEISIERFSLPEYMRISKPGVYKQTGFGAWNQADFKEN